MKAGCYPFMVDIDLLNPEEEATLTCACGSKLHGKVNDIVVVFEDCEIKLTHVPFHYCENMHLKLTRDVNAKVESLLKDAKTQGVAKLPYV